MQLRQPAATTGAHLRRGAPTPAAATPPVAPTTTTPTSTATNTHTDTTTTATDTGTAAPPCATDISTGCRRRSPRLNDDTMAALTATLAADPCPSSVSDNLTFPNDLLGPDPFSLTDESNSNDPDPISFPAALAGPDAAEWQAAADCEMANWKARGVHKAIRRRPGMNIVTGKWVRKTKRLKDLVTIDKRRMRYCARGFSQVCGRDFTDTFAPTLQVTTLRIVLQLACTFLLILRHFDIATAYLYAGLDRITYMEPAPGYETWDEDRQLHVWDLHKAVYGLKISARCWNGHLDKVLRSLGFTQSSHDVCLYY